MLIAGATSTIRNTPVQTTSGRTLTEGTSTPTPTPTPEPAPTPTPAPSSTINDAESYSLDIDFDAANPWAGGDLNPDQTYEDLAPPQNSNSTVFDPDNPWAGGDLNPNETYQDAGISEIDHHTDDPYFADPEPEIDHHTDDPYFADPEPEIDHHTDDPYFANPEPEVPIEGSMYTEGDVAEGAEFYAEVGAGGATNAHVESGDTLSQMLLDLGWTNAEIYQGGVLDAVAELNDLDDPNLIFPSDEFILPTPPEEEAPAPSGGGGGGFNGGGGGEILFA